jgi:hypothetical protein
LVTASPVPPFHGSNPAWILVRYQELLTCVRASTSFTKSLTLNDQLEIGDGATYETTSLPPFQPCQTSHVRPPTVVLPTGLPTGLIDPCRLNQIMISIWLTPLVLGVGSSQMS